MASILATTFALSVGMISLMRFRPLNQVSALKGEALSGLLVASILFTVIRVNDIQILGNEAQDAFYEVK
jgi:hypothetical protein